MRSLSVLNGAMLLGGAEELYVYNVTDGRLIYSDVTPATEEWWNYKFLFMSLLVEHNSLASISQSGSVKMTSFTTFQDVSQMATLISYPSYMSYSNGIVYLTSEYYGTYSSNYSGHKWIPLFRSTLNSSRNIAAVRSSTVAFPATANDALIVFWLIEFSKEQWFLSVYVLEETSANYHFSGGRMKYIPFSHGTIQRNEVNIL
jgi:hypothetical protein